MGPRACTACAKAKTRCIACGNPNKCERCERLNKSCSKQTPAPPRLRKGRKMTRVVELEKKLADLSSQLEISNLHLPDLGKPILRNPGSVKENSDREKDKPEKDSQGQTEYMKRIKAYCFFNHMFPDYRVAEGGHDSSGLNFNAMGDWAEMAPRFPAGRPIANEPPSSNWPQGAEACTLLSEYKDKLMHIFPFVIVPHDLTAAQLQWKRLFLWKAVMVEACHLDGKRQLELGTELLRELSEAAFTRPHKSVDLLQGLLLYLAWFHYALNSFQVTNLPFLARSLCVNLGFNDNQIATRQAEHGSACLEHMRAFAGTYHLVTNVFTTGKRPGALMSAAYIEVICRMIEQKSEYPTDELLVRLVKIQQIAQSITTTFSINHNFQNPPSSVLPLLVVVRSFQEQIDAYKAPLPTYLQDNNLMSHVRIAELFLYGVALQDTQELGPGNLQFNDCLELLWTLLGVTKAFLALRFARPVTEVPRFICISSFDCMYAFMTCLKLYNLEAPGWDLNLVRQDLSLGGLMDRLSHDMELVCDRRKIRQTRGGRQTQGLLPDQDPFQRLTSMLKGIKAVLDSSAVQMTGITGGGNFGATQMARPPAAVNAMQQQNLDLGAALSPNIWQEVFNDNVWNMNDWGSQRFSLLSFPAES
ncbi:uncharacterized protein BCR38DRAFT_477399 [Pseudomassariella vexata]|uniref:Zn(2)-C6 fungal-type domain-containing protein n=1 Tax=Pseudomassariella vexata TaxID=1141098 RepID=A0A1Y2DIN2_9PEZI|nr:uncharacterized protein BCR38DRAFT_477399 [Pseudomassariella vexata]ORY59091.1 hypothetical protein BCR38DRAFT_477399 [Pseudomassariella vexata]